MNGKVSFQFERSSWVKWVGATALGFLINDGAHLLIPSTSIFAFLFGTFLDGLIIALLQWMFVLRSRLEKAKRWILISTFGWAAGWLLVFLLQSGAALFISLFIVGILLGGFQWAFFIRKLYERSYYWILINAIGLPIAYWLSWNIIFPIVLGNYNGQLSGPLDSLIRGSLFGAVTGVVLIWLSRRSQEDTASVTSNTQ